MRYQKKVGGSEKLKTPKVLVVGSLNMDLTLYGAEKVPAFGELVQCSNYAYALGGKGANQAVALTKLGAEAVLVGRVGDDLNGKLLIDALKCHEINIKHVQINREAQTGMAVICADSTGKSRLYGIPGANMTLAADGMQEILKEEKPDMVLMQLEMPMQTAIETFQIAKTLGIPVFLDGGPTMKVPLEKFREIMIISPNEAETFAITGIQVTDTATAHRAAEYIFQNAAPQYVILKLGEHGAYLYDGEHGELYPALKTKAVDSTAAGDTFNAAICFRLCQGESIAKSIAFANAAAAITVSRKGALLSIPTETEVASLLSDYEKEKEL